MAANGWAHTGTHDALVEASQFMQILEERQGLRIACSEEIALHAGWIDAGCLRRQIAKYAKSSYGEYLKRVAGQHK